MELIKLLKNISVFAPRQSVRKRFDEKISTLCRGFLSRGVALLADFKGINCIVKTCLYYMLVLLSPRSLSEWLGADRQKVKGPQRLKDLEFIADNFITQR